MPVARILSRAELALEAPLVQVEVHLGRGLPGFSIVGLPAPVVRESRERVRSALLNSGYDFPARRITVNLAPVELSKRGARFDLPPPAAQVAYPGICFRKSGMELSASAGSMSRRTRKGGQNLTFFEPSVSSDSLRSALRSTSAFWQSSPR